jgi:hypothetical protein
MNRTFGMVFGLICAASLAACSGQPTSQPAPTSGTQGDAMEAPDAMEKSGDAMEAPDAMEKSGDAMEAPDAMEKPGDAMEKP